MTQFASPQEAAAWASFAAAALSRAHPLAPNVTAEADAQASADRLLAALRMRSEDLATAPTVSTSHPAPPAKSGVTKG